MRFGGVREIVNKAASYTVRPDNPDHSGVLFETTGATGSLTFTLPTLNPAKKGWWCEFHNTVNQNMTVTAASNKAICDGNATATSLAATTASHKIGAKIRAEWMGTFWFLSGINNGVTYTVA
jgi:hypothetical protein